MEVHVNNFLDSNYEELLSSLKQTLIIHNNNSRISELYEFPAPYVITIEDCNVDFNQFHIVQLTPGNHSNILINCQISTNNGHRPQHQHNCFELMYVVSGKVIHHVENQFYNYEAGQCCIMNQNIKHCEEFTRNFKAFFISLQDDFLKELMEQDVFFTKENSFQHFKSNIYKFFKDNSSHKNYDKVYLDFTPIVRRDMITELLNPIINHITRETIQQKPGSYSIVKGLIARIFSILEDPSLFCFEKIQSNSSKQEYLFAKISHVLEANHGRISRKKLEEIMNYNGEYLNRIVKKFTGMNLALYGQTFYLNRAKQLLLETDKSIAEIIEELGFSNRHHFYQIFKKRFGLTPKEFRNLNKVKKIYKNNTSSTIEIIASQEFNDLNQLFESII